MYLALAPENTPPIFAHYLGEVFAQSLICLMYTPLFLTIFNAREVESYLHCQW